MLVISRQNHEKLRFPQIGITISFIQLQDGEAKLGIDAPSEILVDDGIDDPSQSQAVAAALKEQFFQMPGDVRHSIRNELHAISIGLHLYREEIAAGQTDEAEKTFQEVQDVLRNLAQQSVLHGVSTEDDPMVD